MELTHTCPICGAMDLSAWRRYPRYVCPTCEGRATSEDRRPLSFFNANVAGGYRSVYTDTDEDYGSHVCFIDGRRCHADEARFGGIVVQLDDDA